MFSEANITLQMERATPHDLLVNFNQLTPEGQDLLLKCARQLRVRDYKKVSTVIKHASADGAKLLGEE